MNPTLSEHQSLLINRTTSESNLDILLTSSDEYMIPKERAESIIKEVKGAMKNWQSEASQLGIPQRELHLFSHRINRSIMSE